MENWKFLSLFFNLFLDYLAYAYSYQVSFESVNSLKNKDLPVCVEYGRVNAINKRIPKPEHS